MALGDGLVPIWNIIDCDTNVTALAIQALKSCLNS